MGPGVRPGVSTSMPGLHNKHGENNCGADTGIGVRRLHVKHNDYEAEFFSSKKNPVGVSEITEGGKNISLGPLQVNRQAECGQIGDPTSATVLQAPTNGPGGGSESGRPGLQNNPHSIFRQQGEVDLVGQSDDQMIRQYYQQSST